ncbi:MULTISPECIES: hypothetical protein [unclassified Micromonospora]|uniref:hypothetical protein n=1 Tax=unclassified Micromonospora TaxID=2617518 RepID=UPI002FF08396
MVRGRGCPQDPLCCDGSCRRSRRIHRPILRQPASHVAGSERAISERSEASTMSRPRLRPIAATIAIALSLAGVVSTPAPASAAFSQPQTVSPAGYDSYDQQQALDRQGDALFVWVRESHTYPHPRHVQIRSRSARGTWGATTNLSPSGQAPHSPRVAVDDDGDAIVVWRAYNGVENAAYARRVSRSGTLGPLITLSAGGVQVHGTNVAIDSDGDAVVTWAEGRADGGYFPMMRRYSMNGSLSSPVVLTSTRAAAETPAVAVDREGDAVIAWANDNIVEARTVSAAGTLSEVKTVSAPLSPIDRHSTAAVTVDRDGDALVTWRHWSAQNQSTEVWGRWVSRDGTVGDVRQLTPASHTDVVNHSVAGDLDGDVLLTWDLFSTGHLYALSISPAQTVGQPVLLSTFGRLHTVRVDDDGDGIVVWQGKGENNVVGNVEARRVTRSGAFGTTEVIVAIGVDPTVAVTPAGRAAVAWERRFQVDLQIQVSLDPYLTGQTTRS